MASEAELRQTLEDAQRAYEQASAEQKGKAKAQYLAALRRFSDFVLAAC